MAAEGFLSGYANELSAVSAGQQQRLDAAMASAQAWFSYNQASAVNMLNIVHLAQTGSTLEEAVAKDKMAEQPEN